MKWENPINHFITPDSSLLYMMDYLVFISVIMGFNPSHGNVENLMVCLNMTVVMKWMIASFKDYKCKKDFNFYQSTSTAISEFENLVWVISRKP